MRIALLGDIHGNTIALDAVLADIEKKGKIDEWWIGGDLVALGPDPIGVLKKLEKLKNKRVIRGNTDRYVTDGDRPKPTIEEAVKDVHLIPTIAEINNTFAWTQGMITAGGWLAWLKALPLDQNGTLPDGTSYLHVHASPGLDDGPGIPPEMPDEELKTLVSTDKNLVIMGHTHLPLDRIFNNIRLINPGAVSLSRTPDRYACYSILEATNSGHNIHYHRVPYDRQKVIDQLNALGHPARGFLIKHLS